MQSHFPRHGHCAVCARSTEQTFFVATALAGEVGWRCVECTHVVEQRSFQEIEQAWAQLFGQCVRSTTPPTHPALPRVFLAHHLGEAEASPQLVQQHMQLTGNLPHPGEALLTLPPGMQLKAFAVPCGKVVRVVPLDDTEDTENVEACDNASQKEP